MSATEIACRELDQLGLSAALHRMPGYGEVLLFAYAVPTGRYQEQRFRIGIGMKDIAYPEYPPHFLHICSLPDTSLPAHKTYEHDGCRWTAFSVPPHDFWDRLSPEEKTMKTYFNRHLSRIWHQL